MRATAPAAAAAAVFALFTPAPALASPLDTYGFGARSIALGGAATAIADDFSAAYYNPAALAVGRTLRLELGYSLAIPRLQLDDADLDVDPSRGFQGGITIPGEVFGRKIAVALGLFLPDGLISRVRTRPQAQPRFVLYDNRPQRLIVSTSAAVEVFRNLYLGAGLTYIASTKGVLDVRGSVNTTNTEHTRLESSVDVTFSSVRTPIFGVLWTPGSWRLGVTYRDEFVLALDLDVGVRGNITVGEEELVAVENGAFILESFNTDLFSPRQIAFGIAYQSANWMITGDLTWMQWSRFPAPVSAIDLTLDLGDLDFEVPVPDKPAPPDFHDIIVPRIGVELDLLRQVGVLLSLRAGWYWQSSPAPDQPGATNYVDGDKYGLSIGLGLELEVFESVLPKPIRADVAFQSITLLPREIQKSSPADPIGDYRAGGTILGGAASLRLAF